MNESLSHELALIWSTLQVGLPKHSHKFIINVLICTQSVLTLSVPQLFILSGSFIKQNHITLSIIDISIVFIARKFVGEFHWTILIFHNHYISKSCHPLLLPAILYLQYYDGTKEGKQNSISLVSKKKNSLPWISQPQPCQHRYW